ncbi:hypothetical protein DFH07DRAFT_765751 [Mycena maculata]|uniref:Uncharacterized protein n=1 Tax=Mycena maculata TaxID=230809 RepID=A0AAD7KB69_9AGAR|nr:hypothetical protein DFH07DRAFT_765751 [Mycena maculata]
MPAGLFAVPFPWGIHCVQGPPRRTFGETLDIKYVGPVIPDRRTAPINPEWSGVHNREEHQSSYFKYYDCLESTCFYLHENMYLFWVPSTTHSLCARPTCRLTPQKPYRGRPTRLWDSLLFVLDTWRQFRVSRARIHLGSGKDWLSTHQASPGTSVLRLLLTEHPISPQFCQTIVFFSRFSSWHESSAMPSGGNWFLNYLQQLGSPAQRLWALLAAQHTIFRREGPGVVYANIRSSRADYDRFRQGTLTEDQYLRRSDVKFGHTNNLGRRMRQYRPCNGNRHFVNWVSAYQSAPRI